MIGVFGDSNAGKSTLINAILGQRLLPQSHSCSTSLFASVTLVDAEVPCAKVPRFDGRPPERLEGRREVLQRLGELNEKRRRASPDADGVEGVLPGLDLEVGLHARACPLVREAGACDGTLTLVDTPGQDEAGGPVSDGRLDRILSLCHGAIVLVRHDRIRSTALAALLDRIVEHAPFLLSGPGALTIVISQVDTLRSDDDASDSEQSLWSDCCSSGAVEEVKDELRDFLLGRECLSAFPGFAREVQILGISVDGRLQGGHEFRGLLGALVGLHSQAKELQRNRRVRLCEAIYETFCDELLDARSRYPARAEAVLELQAQKEGLDVALSTVSAVATIVALPLGGMAISVGCAARITLAGVTLALGVAAGAATAIDVTQSAAWIVDPEGPSLSDEAQSDAQRFGAVGAHEANRQINLTLTARHVTDGKAYPDTLLRDDKTPLYVGWFSAKMPQGPGRLFWPTTGYEAFIGEFEYGLPSRGIFINEEGRVVGHMQVGENGRLEEVASKVGVKPRSRIF